MSEREILRRAAAASWNAEAKLLMDLDRGERFIRRGTWLGGVYTVVRNHHDPRRAVEVKRASGLTTNLDPYEEVVPLGKNQKAN
jgi:hypothetical protein